MTLAVLGDSLIPLYELTYRWPKTERRAKVAYAQSLSFVLYLRQNLYLTPLLTEMRRGKNAHEALVEVTGLNLFQLENRWLRYLQRKHTWIMLFNEGCVWFAMALILVVGYVLVKLRRRRQYETLDGDDGSRRRRSQRGRRFDDVDDLLDESKWGDGWH